MNTAQRRGRGLPTFIWLTVFVLGVSSLAWAQSITGTILGTAKDQSGAVLPGVEITVTNTGTNQVRSFLSNERGDYLVSNLPFGVYKVTATFSGFKTEERQGIEVQVDQRVRIDFTMQIGDVSERIVVTEEAPLVQANSASLGSVVDNQKIQQLPLNSRDFEKLALLVPGATPPQQGSNLAFRGGISIGGANERGNNFTLDGISNTTHNVFTYVYKPSVDEIQEFKVQPNAFDAEAGRGEGGQVTVTTRSGTNAFRGSVFSFIRNDALDARNFFATDKPPFKRNQFGFNVGGPIKRDRLFFFFNYEGLRLRQSETRTATVPTNSQRVGDFSDTPNNIIRDPLTGLPFPGNVIPANRLNPIGLRMMSLYPRQNLPGSNRNFVASPKSPDDSNQYSLRFDWAPSANDTAFARWSRYNDLFFDAYNQQNGFTNIPGFARNDTQHNHAVTLSYTHVFSPTILNTVKAGFSRLLQDRQVQDPGDYVAFLGIPGPIVRDPSVTGVPSIRPTGLDGLGNPSNLPQGRSDLHYQYTDTLAITSGSHSMKFGADIARLQIFRRNFGDDRGNYRFDGRFTRGAQAATAASALADMLLGLPSSATRAIGDSHSYWFETQYFFFFQDDWKVSDRLTLNLGLRYELIDPWYDKFDRVSNFNPVNQTVELAGSPTPQREYLRVETLDPRLAQVSVRFVDLGSRKIYKTDKNNWMPRVGFAWDVMGNGKLALRGGTGLFYSNPPTASSYGNNYPFRLTQTFNNATVPANTGIMPATAFSINNPFAGAVGTSITLNARQKDFVIGYVQKWSLGGQWEFLPNFVLDLDYMGSTSRKLATDYNMNQPQPAPTTGPSIAARRPFQGFNNITLTESSANASYHSLQTRVERRFSGGMTMINSYTWQKVLGESAESGAGESGYQDAYNRTDNRGPASFDYRHRWAYSLVYDLPFGEGRRFGSGMGRAVNAVFGGWQLANILSFQTGRPFTPRLNADNSNTGAAGTDRPNRIKDGSLPKSERTIDRYFDTSAFVIPARGTFGNSGRNVLYGPSFSNVDISLNKTFKIGEEREIQFRSEFFNLLNHANFALPNRDVDSSQFGQIFQTVGNPRQIQFGLRLKF